jgi:hypothetical protein
MDMVRRELVERPDIDNATLFEKAQAIDPAAMEGIDRRQFNARYPLQVKRREMAPRPPRAGGTQKTPRRRSRARGAGSAGGGVSAPVLRTQARDGVRDVLLRFAQDLANAESRGEVVGVVAGVDQYVDRILGLGSFPE